MSPQQERERAYRALMDGIRVLEERIAPLWARGRGPLSHRHRIVRARVTHNGFRELDVLLAHWIGLVARRPVGMAVIGDWRETETAAGAIRAMRFTPEEVIRIAADYRQAAPPLSPPSGCDLAA